MPKEKLQSEELFDEICDLSSSEGKIITPLEKKIWIRKIENSSKPGDTFRYLSMAIIHGLCFEYEDSINMHKRAIQQDGSEFCYENLFISSYRLQIDDFDLIDYAKKAISIYPNTKGLLMVIADFFWQGGYMTELRETMKQIDRVVVDSPDKEAIMQNIESSLDVFDYSGIDEKILVRIRIISNQLLRENSLRSMANYTAVNEEGDAILDLEVDVSRSEVSVRELNKELNQRLIKELDDTDYSWMTQLSVNFVEKGMYP